MGNRTIHHNNIHTMISADFSGSLYQKFGKITLDDRIIFIFRHTKLGKNRVNHTVVGHLREIFSFLHSRRQGSCWKVI